MKNLNKSLLVFMFIFGFSLPVVLYAATAPTLVDSLNYSVLGATTVTNTGPTTTGGEVGVSAGTAITGFPPGVAAGDNSIHLHSNDASAIAAQAENLVIFGALDAGANADANCIGGILPSGTDLATLSPLGPGLYCSGGSFLLTDAVVGDDLVLTGAGPWIFKTASALTTSPGSSVSVPTPADACNVWWRVGSSAILDTTTSFVGNILALTDIDMLTGATLVGRAMVQTAAVDLDSNTISGCAVPIPPPELVVNKIVVNDSGRSSVISDFPLFIDGGSVISGNVNTTTVGVHTVSETYNSSNYASVIGGDCAPDGTVTLALGELKTCTITNDDIASSGSSGSRRNVVPPLIDVVKVPSPLALPNGPGNVTYTYTLKNIGTVPVTDITMVGDSCSPIVLVSGDVNTNTELDLDETWIYRCSTILSETHTNTVTATGWANGVNAVDVASATVVVGAPVTPPLIHVTKIPNPLALVAGSGMVTYTNKVTNPGTVALSNVLLVDDKCSPVKYISGDVNNNSKLDKTETWTYTCRTNLTKTTTNTVTASGEANGLTAKDFAIATVVVSTPGLPRTGFNPASIQWNMFTPAGVLGILIAFYLARKKVV